MDEAKQKALDDLQGELAGLARLADALGEALLAYLIDMARIEAVNARDR